MGYASKYKPETDGMEHFGGPGNNEYSKTKSKNAYQENDTQPKITGGSWMNANRQPITQVNYDENPWILIHTVNVPEGTQFRIPIYSSENGFDYSMGEVNGTVDENGEIFVEVPRTIVMANYDENYNSVYFGAYGEVDGSLVWGQYPRVMSSYLKVSPIRYIPDIMRAQDTPMTVGARFMEHWLNNPANEDSYAGTPIMDLSMDWVLGYNRVNEHYEDMLAEQPWMSPAALENLGAQLQEMFEDGNMELPQYPDNHSWFGESGRNMIEDDGKQIPEFHKYQFQYSSFDQSIWAPLDDLYATLANFNFMFTPFGEVKGLGGNDYLIEVTQLGVYVQDTFDFSGAQNLGCWDPHDQTVQHWAIAGCGSVTNGMFREWREKHEMGMDFRAYSDMRRIDIPYIRFRAHVNEDGKLEVEEWKW